MNILIAGATGATGKLLVEKLLNNGHNVKAIVRTPNNLPTHILSHKNLTIIKASILNLTGKELKDYTKDTHAVVSCLGHNLSLKGMYGNPRKLVRDATIKLCKAIKANNPKNKTKFILMNTTGNSNRDLKEKVSCPQKCVIGLLRLLLPPHVDNEKAADYLRTQIAQNDKLIEWTAVRPDGLINNETETQYKIHQSPTRSPIFNPGKTSRINVAAFMSELITNDKLWQQWKGQMPVIYNQEN